jgi:hypothetical protein
MPTLFPIAVSLESVVVHSDDLAKVVVAVVDQAARKGSDCTGWRDGFVDGRAGEVVVASVEKTYHPVWVPMSKLDLVLTDKRPPPQTPAQRRILSIPVNGYHRRAGYVIEHLICIDGQDPVVAGPNNGVALLRPISVKRSLIPTRPVLEGYFAGSVGGSRVEDHDLAAASKRSQDAIEILFSVPGDQNRRKR